MTWRYLSALDYDGRCVQCGQFLRAGGPGDWEPGTGVRCPGNRCGRARPAPAPVAPSAPWPSRPQPPAPLPVAPPPPPPARPTPALDQRAVPQRPSRPWWVLVPVLVYLIPLLLWLGDRYLGW